MKWFCLISAFALVLIMQSNSSGEESKEQAKAKTIPLDQIWALSMPGTRDIYRLDVAPPERPGAGLLGTILKSLSKRLEDLKGKDLARPGFAISGSGAAALRATHAVFVEGAKPRGEFSHADEITIVFYSEPSGGNNVRIEQVERKGDHIEIQYRLEPYLERTLSETLALIPLGKMPGGEYHVEMRQLPREQEYSKWGLKPLDEKWSDNFLCKPFNFTVTKKRE